MGWWSLTFFLAAAVSGISGFTGEAGSASGIAKLCSALFLILAAVSYFNRRLRA